MQRCKREGRDSEGRGWAKFWASLVSEGCSRSSMLFRTLPVVVNCLLILLIESGVRGRDGQIKEQGISCQVETLRADAEVDG